MKKKNGAKQFMAILLSLILMLGMMPISVFATNAAHEGEHEWADWYSVEGSYHYKQCLIDGCDEKKDYAACTGGDLWAICTVCGNRMEHTCYDSDATCLYGGTCEGCGYAAPKNPDNHVDPSAYQNDENTHRIVCDCGYVYVASEAHTFPDEWSDVEGTDLEERWCTKCLYAQTRSKQPSKDEDTDNGKEDVTDKTGSTKTTLEYNEEAAGIKIEFTSRGGMSFSSDTALAVKTMEPSVEQVALMFGFNSNEYLDNWNADHMKLKGSEMKCEAIKAYTSYSTPLTISEDLTYELFLLDARDISVGGLDSIEGTLSYEIADTWELGDNAMYVATHITGEDVEYGVCAYEEVDGVGYLTVDFDIQHFSPFIIYALVEVDESADETTSNPIEDVTDPPATSDPDLEGKSGSEVLWIVLAIVVVVAGGFAGYWFIIRKKK